MTDRTRDQKPRAIQAAKFYQNDIEQAESVKRQAAIKKQVDAALAAFNAEADGEKRSKLLARYLRLSDKESAEWKRQDDIWARREELWKREAVS